MDRTHQVAIRAIVVIVSVVVIGATALALIDDGVVIEPISVPNKLAEDGYSGVVVARLLLERVQFIRDAADKFGDDPAERDAKTAILNEDQFAALATIQAPSSGLSLRTLVAMLRDFLGISERKIGGAITVRRPDGPDKPPIYRVALVLSPSSGLPARPEEHANLETALLLSARWIARQHDPVGLAAYYLDKGDLSAVKQLADDLLQTGDRKHRRASLFIRGLYEEKRQDKIALFREVIADAPDFIAAYNALGAALASDGKTDEAIEKFGQAIRLKPLSSLAYRNRAAVYKDEKQYELAVADFEQASRLKRTAKIFFDLGYAYEYVRDFGPAMAPKAIKAYDEAIRLKHGNIWALNNRCYMKALLGDGAGALEDCNKALALEENYATYDSRGYANLRLGNFDDAIKDYTKAIESHPQAFSFFGRGLARIAKNQVAEGDKDQLAEGDADIAEARKRDADIEQTMAKFGLRR
jgi:tetratricopeptide (TPR) repeat protein